MIYEYDEETLLRIRERGRAGHSLQEIAIELNVSWSEFFSDYSEMDSPVYIYYHAGVTQGLQATRDKVFTLARGGSVQAAQVYEKRMKEQERSDFLKKLREI